MILNERILAKPIIEETQRANLPDGVLCQISYPICDIGKRNANNRIYEEDVWDKVEQEEDIREQMANRALFGHAEHPEQTQSNLEKTSHVIFEMWRDDGQEWQKMDILDTPGGRIVDCLIRAGCQVGVSTRAEGDLEEAEDDDGVYQRVIAESYKYVTTDFTADPSTFGAIPHDVKRNVVSEIKRVLESKEANESEEEFAYHLLESWKCKDEKKCQNCGCCVVLKEKKVDEKLSAEELTKLSDEDLLKRYDMLKRIGVVGTKFFEPIEDVRRELKKRGLDEKKQYIMEGVWALPNTVAKAKKLAELMKEPLSSSVAIENLHKILGEDELWDEFKYKGDTPRTDDDVRPLIKKRVKLYLEEYEEDPKNFKQKLDPEAEKILKGLVVEQRTIESLIKDKLIKIDTELKYGDADAKVEKIEESIVGIVCDGRHVSIDGAAYVTIHPDNSIVIQPKEDVSEPTPAPEAMPEEPPRVASGSATATIVDDEIPEAKGMPPTASLHIEDGYWYDDEDNKVKVTDGSGKDIVVRLESGKKVTMTEEGFLDKYSRREVPESKEFRVGDTVKIEEGEHKDKEGKVAKIVEGIISITLDDGTMVSIEDPLTVSIVTPAKEVPKPAPDPHDMPAAEVEDMEAAGPLPIEKDIPEEPVEEGKPPAEDGRAIVARDHKGGIGVFITGNGKDRLLRACKDEEEADKFGKKYAGDSDVPYKGVGESKVEERIFDVKYISAGGKHEERQVGGVKSEEEVESALKDLVGINHVREILNIIDVTNESKVDEDRVEEVYEGKLPTEGGVSDKIAPGNLLRDKDNDHFVVKGVTPKGMSLEKSDDGVGIAKHVDWEEVDGLGLVKIGEGKVEEEIGVGVRFNHKGKTWKVVRAGKTSSQVESITGEDKETKVVDNKIILKALGEAKLGEATAVQKEDGWYVVSPSGADLGGPYKSEGEANLRKKDVEFYAASRESKVDEKKLKDLTDSELNSLIKNVTRVADMFPADVEVDPSQLAKLKAEVSRRAKESKEEANESKVEETEDIKAMYQAAKLPAPDGKGIHTKAFHELAIDVAKGYVKSGDSPEEALDKAYPTAMKQLGKEKAVKKPHQKSESKLDEGLEKHVQNILDDADIDHNLWDWEGGPDESRLKVLDKDAAKKIMKVIDDSGEIGPTSFDEKTNTISFGEYKSESKVDEGFQTDLKNRDKKAISQKLGDITDKLLKGESLSGPDKTYWDAYHTAVAQQKESISTTIKEIKDLQVKEASTRAERDKAIELLEELTDEKQQLQKKARKEKAFEVKILIKKMSKVLEDREQEVDAFRIKLEEKLKLVVDLKEQLEEQIKLTTKVKAEASEVAIKTSKYSSDLKESAALAKDKHQKDLVGVEKKHQKKLANTVKSLEEKIEKTKEETEKRIREEVTKEVTEEFVKSFVEFKLSATGLKVDDNSRALLENCTSLEEVDDLLDEIVDAGRRSALHSESISGIHISKHEVVDPEVVEAKRQVDNCFEGMNS